MNVAEKTKLAAELDARVNAIRRTGVDDTALVVAMSDHMAAFRRLMDAAAPGELDRLASRLPGLHHFAVLLTVFATAIRDGVIKVPKDG
jgi:hypothetical protein